MDDKFRRRIQLLVDRAGGQSAFARSSNMSLGAIQRYLKGGDPTRLALIKLAKAGNVSLSWLIYGDEEQMDSSVEARPKYKTFGLGEGNAKDWQEPFTYRVRSELEWPDPECFAVISDDDSFAEYGIKKGFTCFISPNTRPEPDDIVFIKQQSGLATLAVYMKEDQHQVSIQRPIAKSTSTENIEQSDVELIAPVIFVKRR